MIITTMVMGTTAMAGTATTTDEPGIDRSGDAFVTPHPVSERAGTVDPSAGTRIGTPLLPLLAWLSPAYPVGGFAYSHGLEAAVDAGLVHDAGSARAWIADLVEHGSGRQDAILSAAAMRAARDETAFIAVNDLALALAPSRERRLETGAMGRAFADITRAAWPDAAPAAFAPGREIAYPVAFGGAAGRLDLPAVPSLAGFVLAFASTLVSAAVRLGALGQTEAQRVVAALAGPAEDVARQAASATLDDLGACAFRSDIAALHHETLYSRLFRS